MNKYLLGFGNDLRIFLDEISTVTLVHMEPWVFLVNFPIENEAAQNTKQELHANPYIQIPIVIG